MGLTGVSALSYLCYCCWKLYGDDIDINEYKKQIIDTINYYSSDLPEGVKDHLDLLFVYYIYFSYQLYFYLFFYLSLIFVESILKKIEIFKTF